MKNFIRCREDFTCKQCGTHVSGNGYTNHCPNCLWSLHVDVIPGDRAASCGGGMEPVRIKIKTGAGFEGARLLHRCTTCSHEKWNEVSAEDSTEVMLEIMRRMSSAEPD